MWKLKMVENRFYDDLDNIDEYVNLVLHKFGAISWREIQEKIMHIEAIRKFCKSKDSVLSDNINSDDVYYILNILWAVRDEQKILYNKYYNLTQIKENKYDEEDMQLICRLIKVNLKTYFYDFDVLDEEGVSKNIDTKKDDFSNLLKNNDNYTGDLTYLCERLESLNKLELNELCNQLTNSIRKEIGVDNYERIGLGLIFTNELEEYYKIIDNNSQTNVYKQSFISVMANFDAIIFDITEIFLEQYFFKYIGYFEPKNNEAKISLGKFEKYNDFDEMKKDVILNILSSLYAKTVIEKICKIERNEILNEEELKKIYEIFERRNIHLHNRGKVDQKYVIGRNLYDLREDDYAIIDRKYYEDTKISITNFLNRYCIWIKSLSKVSH